MAALTSASAILDLANGLDQDKSVIAGLFAFELERKQRRLRSRLDPVLTLESTPGNSNLASAALLHDNVAHRSYLQALGARRALAADARASLGHGGGVTAGARSSSC